MKIRVTLKDPDTMPDAVADACAVQVQQIPGLSGHEQREVANRRQCEIQSEIASRWMAYGEYLTVEFDTEAWTATVLPAKDTR